MTTPFDENIDTEADSGSGEDSAGDATDAADEQFRKLQQERDSLYERLARTTADFQNTRKRLEAEMDQRLQYANSSLIKSLLPVIDNFERALAVDLKKADSAQILKGLQVVHDQWLTVLKNQSVEVVAPKPGTPFDPSKHEALMQQPSEEYNEPTVTQLLQNGYTLHGRTLRPASVAVSKSN
jgi:molecular chaperone GrpE